MSKKIYVGSLPVGGGSRVSIQTMATVKTEKIKEVVEQINGAVSLGADIVRLAVRDDADALALKQVVKEANCPIVADIHFDYRLALKSIDGGADKIRINPGNIGSESNLKEVAIALKQNGIPVRVGSNTGSIEKEFLEKYGKNEVSLGESALKRISMLEKYGINDIVVSVKASSVPLMVKAYEYVSKRCDYPLHIGVTEAGTEYKGVVKNAIGIGSLLLSGIGDTLRVSLSADPVKEVVAGKAILEAVGLKSDGVEVIACPTCGRCAWNCMQFASIVEDYVKDIKKPLKIAVMGCAVNGPGEAADADLGIAGSKDGCFIFVRGKIVKKISEGEAKEVFFAEIDKCLR